MTIEKKEMNLEKKCPAANERFGASGAVTPQKRQYVNERL